MHIDERLRRAMELPGFPVGSFTDKVDFLSEHADCSRTYAADFYNNWQARQEVPTMSSGYEGYVSSDPLEDAELNNALHYVKPADASIEDLYTQDELVEAARLTSDGTYLWGRQNPLDFLQAEGQKIDAINPSHYTQGGIEAIDAMEACSTDEEFVGHLRLTAMKYCWRLNDKGDPVENAKKCRWYIERLIAKLEAIEETRSDLDSI